MTTTNICSCLWIIFGLVWLIASFETKRTHEKELFSSRLLYGIPIGIGSYLMFSNNLPFAWERTHLLPRTTQLDAAAIFLTVAGISFAIWARFYIGKNWSSAVTIKVGHELIRSGPYTWVRHPIYCGLLVALSGTVWRATSSLPYPQLLCSGSNFGSRVEWRSGSCSKHSANNMLSTANRPAP